MDERDSTASDSPADSEADSPQPVTSHPPAPPRPPPPQLINMNMGAGADTIFSSTFTPPTTAAIPDTTSLAATTVAGGVLSSGSNGGGDLSGKKRRGRPRKYDSDGNLILRPVAAAPYASAFGGSPQPPGFSFSPGSPTSNNKPQLSTKKGRGRGFASGNWNVLSSLGDFTAGGDFTPHIITVNTGEDVAGKILSFIQKGPRGVCVLSANGAVSNVTIRQPGSSGGILTYEGRFEILSLTGSYTITETGGIRSKTGGLSVSLAGPDGRVIGGGVGGLLTAASPIQVVLGSFMPIGQKPEKRKYNRKPTMPSAIQSATDNVVAPTGPMSQTNNQTEIVFGQSSREGNNSADDTHIQNTSSFNPSWNVSGPASNQGVSPDINLSVPSE